MTAITLNDAKENLERIINQVIDDDEPAILCTD